MTVYLIIDYTIQNSDMQSFMQNAVRQIPDGLYEFAAMPVQDLVERRAQDLLMAQRACQGHPQVEALVFRYHNAPMDYIPDMLQEAYHFIMQHSIRVGFEWHLLQVMLLNSCIRAQRVSHRRQRGQAAG